MTVLSRLGFIGIAKEGTPGTYAVPTFYIPVTKLDATDSYIELRDLSYRNNDTNLQGMYQGPGDSNVSIDIHAYPDALPYLLRGIIGPDTVTAGTVTTLNGNTLAGATSVTLTATVPNNSIVRIQDSGGVNVEYAQLGVFAGNTAPVTTPATGLQFAHTAAGGSVSSTSSHLFKQNPTAAQVSWSITKYDVAVNTGATSSRGFPGCKISDLSIKIDPKATVTATATYMGFPSATQANPTPSFSALNPGLGWQWTMTNAGTSSTRGLMYDMNIKRPTEAIHSSDGTIGPREIFQGVLDAEGTYKAVFESDADLNLYLNYTQSPATATITQPVTSGGSIITITNSKSGWYKGKVDLSPVYAQADFNFAGIYNSTDGGALSATVTNFVVTAY